MKKVKIDIVGITNQKLERISGDSSTTKTMIELYNEFVQFIYHSNVKDMVETHFYDLEKDRESNYHILGHLATAKGLTLPLTFINEKSTFHGGISNELIYQEIMKIKNIEEKQ